MSNFFGTVSSDFRHETGDGTASELAQFKTEFYARFEVLTKKVLVRPPGGQGGGAAAPASPIRFVTNGDDNEVARR
ncbi:MAG TPA: hypothetical protein VIW93_15510 [Candidatus Acidoferrum sp.]